MDKLMEYYNSDNPPEKELLKRGRWRGLTYFIIWYHGHPNAYIKIPKGHPLYGVSDEQIKLQYEPHGGFTYSNSVLGRFNFRKAWYIGWDYAHAEDFRNIFPSRFVSEGRKYRLKEIEIECKMVINAIKDSYPDGK